jgi:hypothetical protein
MKIIDHTPYFDTETGKISFFDRARAMLKFGSTWIREVEAQNEIMPVLGKVLDKNYTLLRNVTPPGLEASFPFILVGPTGVFVIYVTPIAGMYRAKGDQWGTISGNALKNEKPNLLTRTERMARAIQVFLQRQGYLSLTSVEAILLCSDLSVHVDSIRPIIRVVLRDALERFAISITQARVSLSPEAVQDVIGRILNPPKPPETPETPESPEPQPTEKEEVTAKEEVSSLLVKADEIPTFAFLESQVPARDEPDTHPMTLNQDQSRAPLWSDDLAPLAPDGEAQDLPLKPRAGSLNKNQWIFVIIMFLIWALLVGVFFFMVIKDQWSYILGMLH